VEWAVGKKGGRVSIYLSLRKKKRKGGRFLDRITAGGEEEKILVKRKKKREGGLNYSLLSLSSKKKKKGKGHACIDLNHAYFRKVRRSQDRDT